MESETVSPVERRRRRRRSREKTLINLGRFRWIRDPLTGIVVFWTMLGIGALYVAFMFYVTWLSSFAFGKLTLDIDKDEVRYLLGAPPAGQEQKAVWEYRESGAYQRVRFDENGMLNSIFCAEYREDDAGCADILTIAIGSTEEQIYWQIGGPDQEFYDGNDKILIYDGMGLTFRLRRKLVIGIETHRRSGFLSFVPEALWMLVP